MRDVGEWNAKYPSGTSVIADVHGARVETETNGNAFALNGRAHVTLKGVPGAVPVSDVRPGYRCYVKLNRRGQVNHWVQGVWDSRDALEADIKSHMDRDERITSYETSNFRPVDM
jgi:hypothetical protein